MATNNSVNTSLSSQTGTGTFVGSTSATLVTPTLGAASATSVNFGNTGNGIIGTTNNSSASAGVVGEIISSSIVSGSPVVFTSGQANTLTSVNLTAGDWDIVGNIDVSGTTTTFLAVGFSTTSSLPDPSLYNQVTGLATSSAMGLSAPSKPLSLSTATTINIIGFVTGTGTLNASGNIYARRVR